MKDNVGNRASTDDNIYVSIYQFLHELFGQLLFTLAVVQQLICVGNQHRPFGFSVHRIQRAAVHCDPWLGHPLDRPLHVSLYHHAAHKGGVVDAGSEDLADSHVINIELASDVGQAVDAGLGYQL